MWRTLLFASLGFGSLCWLTDGAPLQVMSAPNLLRVGSMENIFVECQDCTGDIPVAVYVWDYPAKTTTLASTTLVLSRMNQFQAFGQIMVSPKHFLGEPDMKHYVYLQAQFPDRLLERVVLLSFQSGYIFIQTDKPLYTPNSVVLYRLFGLTPGMEPVGRDSTFLADAVEIWIVTPDGFTLQHGYFSLSQGIRSGTYKLPEGASNGLWRIVAKFQSTPQQNFSTEFEVKEYVLPSFEVKLTPVRPFYYVDSQDFTVNIRATYLFDEMVDGMAYVMFGVLRDGRKVSLPSSQQNVPIKSGAGEAILKREHITKDSNINDLIGCSLFVAVSVLTEGGTEMVEAELKNIQIVLSPYTITLRKTPRYYKAGMPHYVLVEVMNPDGSPAQGVPVVIEPGHIQGDTSANGMTKLPVNTEAGSSSLLISARTNDPKIPGERQAQAAIQAVSHSSKSNSFVYLDVDSNEVSLGDTLKTLLWLETRHGAQRDVTYLVLSRGQLVKYGRISVNAHVMMALTIPITKEMLPSFRIIAYHHTSDNEVVSDSVWVDVKDSCMGKLQLELSRPAPFFDPNGIFALKVTGDPDSTVALVGVDKGVHALNNNHRLTQKKVWDIIETFDIGCTTGGGKDAMGVFYDAGLLFQSSVSGTPDRLEMKCSGPTRRKRASSTMEATTNSNGDDVEFPSFDISPRIKFPESWLWLDQRLPACQGGNPNCDSTSHVRMVPIPDSITTWQFTGISMSRTNGICVSEPLEVKVQKDFFLDLKVPYTAVKQEQMEIKAILYNYSPDPIIVRVDLLEEQHLCSAAFNRGRYRQQVEVGPRSQRSVPFIISPLKEGLFTIGVEAVVKDSLLTDGIRKTLRVLPQGVLTKSKMSVILDPSSHGGTQEEVLKIAIPNDNLVQNSPTSTLIYVTGRQVSALKENVISGNGMETLIHQPSGDGEANMIRMTQPVIATVYLDKTNQWATVGFHKRSEALQHINYGYQQELNYRKSDGSFAVRSKQSGSSWLTAYVVKLFAMVTNLVPVQSNVVCDAVKFLIINVQQPNGLFEEHGQVVQKEMIGDVSGTDSDASMTAFCLIAMQESRTLCSGHVHVLPSAIDKAVTYLENRLPSLTNPYAVAMVSYAMANENKLNQEILYRFASPDRSHWPVAKGQIYTLEATAYALLALIKTKAFEEAKLVVRWLNQQQRVNSGYGSTQATMMVYQALAEYWISESDSDLYVTIILPDRSMPQRFRFNRQNHLFTTMLTTRARNHNVSIVAEGTGQATVTMLSQYYAPPVEQSTDCQKFNLSVQLSPVELDEMTYWLHIHVIYKDPLHDATMSILDIGLPTGFTVNTEDLDALSQGRARTISKYEMGSVLSKRGSLIIYLDKVSHTTPEEIRFRIHQKFKVGVFQPAAVSVFEYHDQTNCVKFYQPKGETVSLLCTDDECICDDGTCTVLKVGVSNDERMAKVCEQTSTSKTDFVYKVQLDDFRTGLANFYTMRILQVIKEGSYDISPSGKLRTFIRQISCRQSLDLRPGKTYLVMGPNQDIRPDSTNQGYSYSMSERIWMEYWPTAEECVTEVYKPTCVALESLVESYLIFGCPSRK